MTTRRSRWRSRAVNLRLLGTAGSLVTLLAGCSNATQQRNVYRDSTDCAADYSSAICAQHGFLRSIDRFFGPVYRMVSGRHTPCKSTEPGPGPAFGTRRTGVEPVSRFGFGASCSSRTSGTRSGGGSRHSFWSGGG